MSAKSAKIAMKPSSSLLMLSFLCLLLLQARGEGVGSTAVFVDGASHRYLRDQPVDAIAAQSNSMTVDEVAATVSVLLGFAPPASFAADSSSKLNNILLPNPFDRPRAVFVLQVDGSDVASLSIDSIKSEAGSIFKTRVLGANNATIQLADEDVVLVVRSDESLANECDSTCLNKELSNLANWLGGSYIGSLETMDGKLSLPLESGRTLNLEVGKEAELQFASSLISLLSTVKKGIQIHEDFSGSILCPAELLICHFTGIKALEEEDGSADIINHGMEVLQTAFTKSFDLLQRAYEGKLVGLVIYKKEAMAHSGAMIDVTSSSLISRLLEEAAPLNATVSEVLLVRQSLAWITGIILLVSTLIGVCLLMNMPLTRDTLLYSNVKLD